jgi:hypothetical protein
MWFGLLIAHEKREAGGMAHCIERATVRPSVWTLTWS